MPKLNYPLLLSNIREAADELNELVEELQGTDKPDEAELEIGLAHAFHHLNFAWNARRATERQYRQLTDERFNKWSKFPRDIPITKV
ncbi:MAG: hypothetical protein ACYC8T_20415 [Myxococcaceae bacterium]